MEEILGFLRFEPVLRVMAKVLLNRCKFDESADDSRVDGRVSDRDRVWAGGSKSMAGCAMAGMRGGGGGRVAHSLVGQDLDAGLEGGAGGEK